MLRTFSLGMPGVLQVEFMGGVVVVRSALPLGATYWKSGVHCAYVRWHVVGAHLGFVPPAGGFQNQEWYAFMFRLSRGESDSEIDTPFVNPQRTSHHVTCGGILAWCLNCVHFRDFEVGAFTLRHLPTVVRTPLLQSRSCYKC